MKLTDFNLIGTIDELAGQILQQAFHGDSPLLNKNSYFAVKGVGKILGFGSSFFLSLCSLRSGINVIGTVEFLPQTAAYEQAADGVGRLGAVREPGLDAVGFHNQWYALDFVE